MYQLISAFAKENGLPGSTLWRWIRSAEIPPELVDFHPPMRIHAPAVLDLLINGTLYRPAGRKRRGTPRQVTRAQQDRARSLESLPLRCVSELLLLLRVEVNHEV